MNEAMSQMPMGEGEKGGKGALVGAVIVVLILILGGIYFFSNRKDMPGQIETPAEAEEETAAIEAELNTIDINGTDSDFQEMDAVINGL